MRLFIVTFIFVTRILRIISDWWEFRWSILLIFFFHFLGGDTHEYFVVVVVLRFETISAYRFILWVCYDRSNCFDTRITMILCKKHRLILKCVYYDWIERLNFLDSTCCIHAPLKWQYRKQIAAYDHIKFVFLIFIPIFLCCCWIHHPVKFTWQTFFNCESHSLIVGFSLY